MKYLKKLLIVVCFSFIFLIGNVFASVIDISYTTSDIERYNQYSNILNNIKEDLINRNLIGNSSVLYYNFSFLNTWNYIQVHKLTSDYIVSEGKLWGNYYVYNVDNNGNITFSRDGYGSYGMQINILTHYGYFDFNQQVGTTRKIINNSSNSYLLNSNSDVLVENTEMNFYNFIQYISEPFVDVEPSYTIQQQVLDNGNVKLTFNFTNYDTNNGYGFTITNKVNGQEYGITNPFTSIFPNIIPFGNSYEIILDYDTIITISLSKYTLIEGTQLYDREPLYVDSYDINNVVFDNISQPYFSVLFQNKSNIIGAFNNIDNSMSCYYKFSSSSTENQLNCFNSFNLDFYNNGYIEFIIKKQNNIIYSRKVNMLGGSVTDPYIVYNIEKQDFYTRLNWHVENYNNQLKFRYSLDNGLNFSTWTLLSNNQQFLNVFENSVVIIEVSDNSESTIYDSKAINVIVSVENLKNFNNTTNNLIDKFNNIFNVNGNILLNIESMWSTIKSSKIYLFVFIPFITSIICAIIYLIRR